MNYNFFNISDLFDVYTGGDKPKENDYSGVKVNSIENLTTNNGVKEEIYYSGKNIFSNFISVVSIGKGGKSFYQENPSAIFTRVKALIPKGFELNIHIAMYLTTLLDMEQFKYSYGRVVSTKKLKETRIKLPVDLHNQPNWLFMENYIKNIDESKLFNKIVFYKKTDVKLPIIDEWKSFKIYDLFHLKKGKRLTKENTCVGNTVYLSSKDNNNNFDRLINLEAIYEKNTLTVNSNGSVGSAFYHEYSYWASDNTNVLVPKFNLNKYIALFLTTVIESEKYRFCYGRLWNTSRMNDTVIKLPVTEFDQPDWNLMETYIRSLPYSEYI